MSHPARKHITLTLQLSLDEADALVDALARSSSLSSTARTIRLCLAAQLRKLAWTRLSDTPNNFDRLQTLLRASGASARN